MYLLLFGFSLLVPRMLFGAPNCPLCVEITASESADKASLEKHQLLLKRNQEYLAQLPEGETSKAIKVRSNIVVINLRIETLENQLQIHTNKKKEAVCEKCP